VHTHHQIVIGFDGGEDALRALHWARGFASLSPGTVLHLTHALALPAVPMHSFHLTVDELLAAFEREIRVQLAAARDELVQNGFAAEVHVRHWLPADTLLEQAEALGATLIVVGQQGGGSRSGRSARSAKRWLIGSTSGAVSREAKVPVVVVRGAERPSPPRRILVGADGSAGSRSALLAASKLFPDARLLLAHVQEADRTLDLSALASSAGIEPGRTELHSLEGDAAATLLALAASSEADLLCAGRIGASPLRDLLLGSVSEKLLQLSPCPLLLAH
jgi:nucleotide-binding universal stress UspA family protein